MALNLVWRRFVTYCAIVHNEFGKIGHPAFWCTNRLANIAFSYIVGKFNIAYETKIHYDVVRLLDCYVCLTNISMFWCPCFDEKYLYFIVKYLYFIIYICLVHAKYRFKCKQIMQARVYFLFKNFLIVVLSLKLGIGMIILENSFKLMSVILTKVSLWK